MQRFFAIIVLLLGIFLGLYLGLWVMFVGGIAAIINHAASQNYDGYLIAWNVAKIVFAAPVGWIIFVILAAVATAIAEA